MKRADFYYEICGDVVCIMDLNQGGMSVTNDIENVLAQVRAKGDLCSKIIYQDSQGIWDQVIVDSAMQFLDFRSLNEKDMAQAIRRVREAVVA